MNEQVHLSRQFDAELERLRSQVLQMGGLVETQITSASAAYAQNDAALATRVVDTDKQVNALQKNIDNDCIHVIAKRQPTASDLRLIMSISKMATDLERIGDEAKKMAKCVRRIQERGQRLVESDTANIRHLAAVASALLRRALDAFARLDSDQAETVIRDDKELDREFKAVIRQVITYMMEDPRTITTSIDITTIARAIERIGDHAKNVAEQVVYIDEGKDIRYGKINDGEEA
ncbi:MAG: Phosphate-specific transport system accessory protein PhoU [Betaproteobacteria bacterium ADurb.Bin341]|nr:MAG: Phosphate-specific transport system accessory protein PhoU [Betaproteobacteria bacterium ADurb.Bin341]